MAGCPASGPGDLTSVTLKPATASVVAGATVEYTALGTFADGSSKDFTGSAAWTSSDPAVATLTAGTTTITASVTSGSVTLKATSALTVTPKVTAAELKSIAVTAAAAASTTVPAGATVQLLATGTRTDDTIVDVTSQVIWASETPAAATVNNLGAVRGVGPGSAKISATLGTISGSLTVTVTPAVISSISVTPSTIASVNSVGVVTAAGVGTQKIDACTGGVCASTGTDRQSTVTVQ